MNLALPAIIVFCLVLPGFVFRISLRRASTISLDYSPFGKMVTSSLSWAVGLHLFWVFLTNTFTKNQVDPALVFGLLSSDKDLQGKSIALVSSQFGSVAFYFITLLLTCFFVPKLVRVIVDKYKLDGFHSGVKRFFRFDDADWYYLFSGVDLKGQPDFISLSAVVEVGKESFIYKGALEDYFTDSTGELTRLVISGASRRRMERTQELSADTQDGFYPINGDYFVLKYSDIQSLNVHYIKIDPETGIQSSLTASA